MENLATFGHMIAENAPTQMLVFFGVAPLSAWTLKRMLGRGDVRIPRSWR